MKRQKKCRACGLWYTPCLQTYRRQKVCSNPACRDARQRWASRRWKLNNLTYDDNRAEEHRKWRQAHGAYWRSYRSTHPTYVKHNRQLQRQRDRKRRNLANRHDSNWLHRAKLIRIRGFGVLANRHDSRVPMTRQTEEICRYLDWGWLLAKRNESDKHKRL